MSVNNVCAQLTADPSMLISAFHNQLTADRTQAVPAINHTKLSILWCNGHVEPFLILVCVPATMPNISWHCNIKSELILHNKKKIKIHCDIDKSTINHQSSHNKIEKNLQAN